MKSRVGLIALCCAIGLLRGEGTNEPTEQTAPPPYSEKLQELRTELDQVLGPPETDAQGRHYFPQGKNARHLPGAAPRHAQILAFLEEPSIQSELPDGVETIIRLSVMNGLEFQHDWVVIRLEISGDKVTGRTATFKLDQTNPTTLATDDRDLEFTSKQTDTLEKLLRVEKFWSPLPEEYIWRHTTSFGSPSIWVFEMRSRTGYQIISVENSNLGKTHHPENRDWSAYETAANLMRSLIDPPMIGDSRIDKPVFSKRRQPIEGEPKRAHQPSSFDPFRDRQEDTPE
ncbi:hypothetical protein [Sulfuriroseicoccus oceanibius]|uniref:Uncharacterized protein n=1 Tax=Sulfuriroseicoccus oceanibius TaxID=2707525 RepID=A0A6B3L6J6_9BACT|nr:hypothetical protein [Sulfuriroseicoccus oceanibius]QQL43683.1 hypothetical protein G3M56_007155 [Sulfuriroseicoccus oceanibius]